MEFSRQTDDSVRCESERGTPQSLSGEWEGHYSQHEEQHPIRAVFTQEGKRLSGTMIDGDTESDRSLDELASEGGVSPGVDEFLDAQLRQIFPGSGASEVRIQTVLPRESRLEGTVVGDYLVFTKTYIGEHRIRYLLGDRGLEHVLPSHSVRYDGRILSGSRRIEGHWTIYHAESNTVSGRGTFVLKRVEQVE